MLLYHHSFTHTPLFLLDMSGSGKKKFLHQTNWLKVGKTRLSLALGNMVVTRQILLIFNLSYLPCSVQFVNKNYCHAKNDLFTTCWCHYFVREWCIVSLEEVLMNTPSGRKPSVVLTSKVRWARLENGCVRKTVGNFYKKNVQTWSYTFLKEEFP